MSKSDFSVTPEFHGDRQTYHGAPRAWEYTRGNEIYLSNVDPATFGGFLTPPTNVIPLYSHPVTPTEEMLVAALKELDPVGELVDWRSPDCTSRADVRLCWNAMLGAAPGNVCAAPQDALLAALRRIVLDPAPESSIHGSSWRCPSCGYRWLATDAKESHSPNCQTLIAKSALAAYASAST